MAVRIALTMAVRSFAWVAIPALVACIVSAALPIADARLVDVLFTLHRPAQGERPVVLISGAPEVSIRGIPWGYTPRELAALVRKAAEGGARCIVIGITALTRMPDDEEGIDDLADALRAAGRVVLPACLIPDDGAAPPGPAAAFQCGTGKLVLPAALRRSRLLTPPLSLVRAAAGLGTTNLYPDLDGVVRTFPLMVSMAGTLYPSLPLEAVRVFAGLPKGSARLVSGRIEMGEFRMPVLAASAEMLLNMPAASPVEGMNGAEVQRASADELRRRIEGKVVVIAAAMIGSSAVLPVRGSPPTTGPHIVAACIDNILSSTWVHPTPPWVGWLATFLLAAVAATLARRMSPVAGIASGLALAVAVCVAVVLGGMYGVQVPALAPLLGVVFAATVNVAGTAAVAEREKAAAEAAFESRLRALDRIGELIGSAMDRDELLNAMMRWISHEMQAEACSLLLLDQQHQQLRFEIALGPKGKEVQDFAVPLGHGIAGVVAQTGQPLIVNDAWRDPRHAQEISSAIDFRPRNILCVPMRLHGRVIGVIEVMNKMGGDEFTRQDEYLLTTIAAQAALLLENAQLIAELQRRIDYANEELRKAYRELASEKAKVETLIDQMASPVIATDADNNIVLINDAAEEALGIRAGQAIGHDAIAVIPVPAVAALFAVDLEQCGGRVVEELEVECEDGSMAVYQASLALVHGPDGQVMGKSLVMTDVTEFRELDRMKTDLISFVAHELNNPLSTIVGWASLCRRRLRGGQYEQTEHPLEIIERQARRTERLVQDFLNLARLEAGRPLDFQFEPITNLAEIVQQVIELEPRRRDDHRFVVDIPTDLPPVYADRNKLEEVLTNLISNAVKYSPDGGTIRVSAEPDGEWVRVSVSDEGVGIPPEHLRNLFEKFHRVPGEERARVPGTGIGLYLCRQLVEGHGGRIWVDSQPGRGTTVHFTLPTRPPRAESGNGQSPS